MNLQDLVAGLQRFTRSPRDPKLWHWLVVIPIMFSPIGTLYVLKRYIFPNTPTLYLIPACLPLLVIGFIFIMRINKPHPPHCCSTCGYNLTGNVSGKCPECGTALSRGL